MTESLQSGTERSPLTWYYPILAFLCSVAAVASLLLFAKNPQSIEAKVLVVAWSTLPPAYFFFEYWLARRRERRDIAEMAKTQELARHVWLGVVGAMIALASMGAGSQSAMTMRHSPTQSDVMSWGSVPDWINVFVVIILAAITFWYAKTTACLAESATEQARSAQKTVQLMASQWRVQEMNEFLPLQLAILETLTYIPALRHQIETLEQSNTSISASEIVKDSYASAVEIARKRSLKLLQLLDDAKRQLKTASGTMGTREFGAKPELRKRAVAELDEAAATLSAALECARRDVFPHVAGEPGAA